MQLNLANNCRPKFKKEKVFWIEDRNGKNLSGYIPEHATKQALKQLKQIDKMAGIMSRMLLTPIEPKQGKSQKQRTKRFLYRKCGSYGPSWNAN